jgi:hypothetical protein
VPRGTFQRRQCGKRTEVLDVLLIALGLALVGLALFDATVTTLAAGKGGGPLTRYLARWGWQLLRLLARGQSSSLLSYAGMLVLLLTVLTWVLLLWGGWFLVFLADEGAVVDASTSTPADLAGRAYYAAFVVFTLGTGDVVPGSGGWQLLTGLATFLGLFLVTLSITYLVSVVSAAVGRRALARTISLSGETGIDLVLLHAGPQGVSGQFTALTQALESQVLKVVQQHLAYPVLHHFHADGPASSAPRAMAVLDDALLLVSEGLAPQVRPGPDVLTRLRRAVEHYAETVAGQSGSESPPPLPSLDRLRAAGIPTVDDEQFAAAAGPHAARRRQVHRLVTADAWTWPT